MRATINIVTRQRPEVFAQCCLSVARALPLDTEVLVLINGEDKTAEAWLEEFAHPAFRWHVLPKGSLAQARNVALDIARGEILYCLDDDVQVPLHLFEQALELFRADPELAILGGPNLTPQPSAFWPTVFGAVMLSPFAAPRVRRRYGASLHADTQPATEFELMFCNLAIRKNKVRAPRFESHLRSNEENLFLRRAIDGGAKALYHRDLYVYHHRRDRLSRFVKQVSSYGFGRAQQIQAGWHPSYRLFLVPVFLWPLMWGLILTPVGRLLFLCLGFLHLMLSAVAARYVVKRERLGAKEWIAVTGLTSVVHLAYGFGFWRALFGIIREGSLFKGSGSHQVHPPIIKALKRLKWAQIDGPHRR